MAESSPEATPMIDDNQEEKDKEVFNNTVEALQYVFKHKMAFESPDAIRRYFKMLQVILSKWNSVSNNNNPTTTALINHIKTQFKWNTFKKDMEELQKRNRIFNTMEDYQSKRMDRDRTPSSSRHKKKSHRSSPSRAAAQSSPQSLAHQQSVCLYILSSL